MGENKDENEGWNNMTQMPFHFSPTFFILFKGNALGKTRKQIKSQDIACSNATH